MDHSLPFMAEAHRLVLSQRLSEATVLIQERLNGRAAPPASPAPFDGPTVELTALPGTRARVEPQPAAEPALRSRPRFPLPQAAAFRAPAPRAAPAVPAGAQFLRLEHAGVHGRRAFRLYVPAAEAAGPRPLVVMLHGCTQDPEDFAAGTRMNEVAEAANVLVAYPEQPRSANPSSCWNWFEPAHQGGGAGEPALIGEIVEDVARLHAVDRDRVFVAGLSAGGAMAAVLGATRPDLFAAVGVHSGLPHASADSVASALAVMRSGRAPRIGSAAQVPTIVFHGARDTTVHPANGAHVAGLDGALRGAGETVTGSAEGRGFTRTVLGPEGGRPAAEHWRIEGLGHAWSGGSAAGSYADPAGPDASREMLRFFLEHPRRR